MSWLSSTHCGAGPMRSRIHLSGSSDADWRRRAKIVVPDCRTGSSTLTLGSASTGQQARVWEYSGEIEVAVGGGTSNRTIKCSYCYVKQWPTAQVGCKVVQTQLQFPRCCRGTAAASKMSGVRSSRESWCEVDMAKRRIVVA
ncbi:hypothetical protein C8J57DRAFT_1483107 [Mycena rebaudengoi]|nr:hypothetical protein C8J57DRAFT_1483107 [Mycena rebaudengoi]